MAVPGSFTRAERIPERDTTEFEREWSTGSAVTLGFSLHYGDRFFVDVFSGSEIIPSYLPNATIDIRCAF